MGDNNMELGTTEEQFSKLIEHNQWIKSEPVFPGSGSDTTQLEADSSHSLPHTQPATLDTLEISHFSQHEYEQITAYSHGSRDSNTTRSGGVTVSADNSANTNKSSPMIDYLKNSCKRLKAMEACGMVRKVSAIESERDGTCTTSLGTNGQIVPSNKGGLKYIYMGYEYTTKKVTNTSIYWTCSRRKRTGCQGSLRTSHEIKDIKILKDHVHEPGSSEPRQHLIAAMASQQHNQLPGSLPVLQNTQATPATYTTSTAQNKPAKPTLPYTTNTFRNIPTTHATYTTSIAQIKPTTHAMYTTSTAQSTTTTTPAAATTVDLSPTCIQIEDIATHVLRSPGAKHTTEALLSSVPVLRPCSTQASKWNYQTLAVSMPEPYVAHVELNRPEKGNAMNLAFWREMVECFKALGSDSDVRAIVISGRGKLFTGGLDLMAMIQDTPDFFDTSKEIARRAKGISTMVRDFQQSFTQIEQCPQPVIAAVHSACVGGGVDLTTACDIRYCSSDAYFQVKEVDLGLAADVGTLQRLPKIVGNGSFVKDICYTARKVHSQEALQMGLVSRVLADKDSCIEAAMATAKLIAEKSPVAVQTTKESLNYSRDHPVSDSLNHVRLLNQCMLQSEDVLKSAQAAMSKEKPIYSKL